MNRIGNFRRLQLLTRWSHDEENTPYSPEVRERAVRMIFDRRDEYASQYEAIRSISVTFVIHPAIRRAVKGYEESF
jgi:hypothetical protein